MEIVIRIEAPELVEAVQMLAAVTAGNIEVLMSLPQIMEITGKPLPGASQGDVVPEPPTEPEPETEPNNVVTLEQVRTKLANLSRNGKQAEVKSLINKYASKLTEIPAENYGEILKAAEEL